VSPAAIDSAASTLLAWYDRYRRVLPWRAAPGQTPNPYHVWLSEVMLQQTTVTAAIPYYQRFVRRFPTLQALAAAPIEEVMAAWAGLGYYARARHLHTCARIMARDGIPRVSAELRRLPGIGHYTATAIAAIAFNQPGVPVDGNVERVVARAFAITQPLPGAKPAIQAAAIRLGEAPEAQERPSDFAQALFDLGATICTPAEPSCFLCPWAGSCAGLQAGMASALPSKAPPRERPVRYGVHFWLADGVGNVLLRRRPAEGLLGGMTELPGTTWRAEPWDENAFSSAPMPAAWRIAGEVRHGFTHFELRLRVMAAEVADIHADGMMVPIETLAEQALPSVMRKCAALCAPQAASASTSRRRGTARTGIAA
jgi:A/G-specific adenine glycosylase